MRKSDFQERNEHTKAKLGSELSLPTNPSFKWLCALMTLPDLGHCQLSSGSLFSQDESSCSLRDLKEIEGTVG